MGREEGVRVIEFSCRGDLIKYNHPLHYQTLALVEFKDVASAEMVLEVQDRWCGRCGLRLHVHGHRRHRNVRLKKGGAEQLLERLIDCIDKGKSLMAETQKQVANNVEKIQKVDKAQPRCWHWTRVDIIRNHSRKENFACIETPLFPIVRRKPSVELPEVLH
jgi:hypothetical protein